MGRRVRIDIFLMMALTALICSACSKQSQPSSKDNANAVSQLSGTDTGKTISQLSETNSGKTRSQPSDEDIIKAIDDSGIMKRPDGSFTVIPPPIVAKRERQAKDGSWPVMVTFTLTYKLKDGRTSAPTKTTTKFKIFRAEDKAGKLVWKAQLGS